VQIRLGRVAPCIRVPPAPLRLAVVHKDPQTWKRDDLAGGRCYLAPDREDFSVVVLDIGCLRSPCIGVKPSGKDGSVLRFLPLPDLKRL
jgi:hypothetical protein